MKPTNWKSYTRKFLIWSDLTLDPSFKLKSEKPKLKLLITRLFLVLEVLTLDPSFKFKRWLIGFGELSFWFHTAASA